MKWYFLTNQENIFYLIFGPRSFQFSFFSISSFGEKNGSALRDRLRQISCLGIFNLSRNSWGFLPLPIAARFSLFLRFKRRASPPSRYFAHLWQCKIPGGSRLLVPASLIRTIAHGLRLKLKLFYVKIFKIYFIKWKIWMKYLFFRCTFRSFFGYVPNQHGRPQDQMAIHATRMGLSERNWRT